MAAKVEDRHICPCCKKYMFEEDNSYDICDVCNWMDSAQQEENPNLQGGANRMSLNQAKEAFKNNVQVR